MIIGALVTLAVVGSSTPPSKHVQRRLRHPDAVVYRRPVDSSDLYSLRARRRFASYLRLRILELRAANLERAAAVVQRHLPLSALLGPDGPSPGPPLRGIPTP